MVSVLSAMLISFLFGLLSYKLVTSLQARAISKQNGCAPLPHYHHKEPFFGLDKKLGALYDVLQNRRLEKLDNLFEVYGSTFESTSLGRSMISSRDPKIIQHVWGTNDQEWGAAPFRLVPMESFCGLGFATTDGALWEHYRNLTKPAFHKAKLADLSFFISATEALFKKIPRDGSTIDIQPLLFTMFNDTASQFLLNQSSGAITGIESSDNPVSAEIFLEEWDKALRGLALRLAFGSLRCLLPRAKWNASCATVDTYIEYFVEQALRAKPEKSLGAPQSLLENLVLHSDQKVEIRNHLIQAMMAAQDTTPVLVSNAIFLLSRHQPLWKRLQQEVKALPPETLTFDSLKSHKLLQNILHETLRLYPVFPFLARVALKDTLLPHGGGPSGQSPVFVRKGTRFVANFYSLHRDPAIYGEDVEAFIPDRWKTIKPAAYEFMAFGQGRRKCLGQQKALVEAACFLVLFAREFGGLEGRDDRDWKGKIGVTTRNANGCLIAVGGVGGV